MSLDTLRSQAFGAKNYELVGILTQRGTLICSLLMIPCGLSWWFATGPVLRGIGVDEEIVELSALYCKVALGNLWPMLTQNMAIGFLRCQRIVKPVTWMQAATQVITLPLSYVLITTYGCECSRSLCAFFRSLRAAAAQTSAARSPNPSTAGSCSSRPCCSSSGRATTRSAGTAGAPNP